MPPPPAAAFSMIGKPIFFATARTSSSVSSVPGEPGTTGTPAAAISLRASTLSPICTIASGGGPINTMPGFADRARKAGVLGKEAVARMNRFGAGGAGGIENASRRSDSFAPRAAGPTSTA